MRLSLEELTPALGAEVLGVDLRKPLGENEISSLNEALQSHLVLFFRDQALEPDEQLQLARRFGEADTHAFGRHLPDFPQIGVLDQQQPEHDGANRWHTDSTFMEQPPRLSILRAVQLPASGGDTCWASMYDAFGALSPPMQRTLAGLTATHDIRGPLERAARGGHSVGDIDEIRGAWPPRSHPLVCRHPETGRRMLYANSNFTTKIDGLSEAESEAILGFLFDWVASPELQVRFRWEPDSVAIWDNRCTQHYAVADYHERRIMHRVSVTGDWAPSAEMAA